MSLGHCERCEHYTDVVFDSINEQWLCDECLDTPSELINTILHLPKDTFAEEKDAPLAKCEMNDKDPIKNVVICPNCGQKLNAPKGSSLITCYRCKEVFDYPTFKLESHPQKEQLHLFEGQEKDVPFTHKLEEQKQGNPSFVDTEPHLLGEARDKTTRLFDYIAKVLSIDLPVIRNIIEHKEQLWWLNDVPVGSSCRLRKVDSVEASEEASEEEWWLSVRKTEIKEAPSLPEELQDWVELDFHNPSKLPEAFPSRSREVSSGDYYNKEELPENADKNQQVIDKELISERFEDDPTRADLLNDYIANQWGPWSKKFMPYFRANRLYRELYSLHQRLQIDGERIELLFGHALLTWKHKEGVTISHPLFVTPIEIHFDPDERVISLLPSATLPTTPEFDCLRDLEYDNMTQIVELTDKLTREPPNVWDNEEIYGWTQTITGLISPEGANKYDESTCSNPPIMKQPSIWNAPNFFVRPRAKKFWVQDAEQVRDNIKEDSSIPWFISSLTSDPADKQLTNNVDDENVASEYIPEGELLLPLKYNDEQKEIVQRLRKHNGVLVQGPPGTGKSHTIANIICSLLARGKRVLVTAQTDRALRVLREKIPKEIQSLCVSQLSSDRASRGETKAAVNAICAKLDRANTREIQSRIDEIRQKLRSNREHQARLRNALWQCEEVNFETLPLGVEKIDAVKAAKEISANQKEHGWLPDKLAPSDEPPLTNEELEELCQLLSQIDPKDQKILSQGLPRLSNMPSSGEFNDVISHLKGILSALEQFEEVPTVFREELDSTSTDFIDETNQLTKEALAKLCNIREDWQHNILSHLSAQGDQRVLWHEFASKAHNTLNKAWPHFKKILHHEISCTPTQSNIDYELGISQLWKYAKKGKKLKKPLFGWPKEAKAVLQCSKVDGAPLATVEQLEALGADFNYKKNIRDFKKFWSGYRGLINAPDLRDDTPLPLQDFEEKLNQVKEVLDWEEKYGLVLTSKLDALGVQQQKAYQVEFLREFSNSLEHQHLVREDTRLNKIFKDWVNNLPQEACTADSRTLWGRIRHAFEQKDYTAYQEAYNEVIRLNQLTPKILKLEALLSRLSKVAPLWASQLKAEAVRNRSLSLPKAWQTAWRWSRLSSWLDDLHRCGDIDSLQKQQEREKDNERQLVTELVTNLTWQRQIELVTPEQRQALIAWSQADANYGKGTGPRAHHYLAAAREAMRKARGAVPIWIMPLHRVVQSFSPPCPDMFDVVIVDEASQCDIRAIPVLYRAKKVLIIGDPQQISPAGLFINKEKVFQLIKQFLKGIPFPESFAIENSLYHIAELRLPTRTFLKEHFRSVPEIIEFSNHHVYVNDRIEPLRIPNPGNALLPTLNAVPVRNGFKNENNDVNEPEAEALVNRLVECCKNPKHKNKTMGVISLLGEQQAKYIDKLLSNSLDEQEIDRRKIICGDAYSFQGDERDVMFLSLVIANNAGFNALAK
ncbi:MAG: AAA family ATPase [Candidatus Brocadiales bacterium]|nr:AAA family ATPase [Candidatus Bathyanammoxibius amoris]